MHEHLISAHRVKSEVFCRWVGCSVGLPGAPPFEYDSSVERHTRHHSRYRPYKCSACNEEFAARSVRNEHFTNIHIRKESFPCDLCSHQCTGSYNLQRHKYDKHHPARLRSRASRQALIKERRSMEEKIYPPPLENFPGQEEKGSTHHWLPDVFSQSRPATLFEDTGQTSILLGPPMPGSAARLSESYTNLLELLFEDGDLLVRIYQRSHDARSRILCRTVRPLRLQQECNLPLVSLLLERSGPFLKLHDTSTKKQNSLLWACLKFGSYESTFVDHCSLYPWVVALRAAGTAESSP